MATDPMPWEIAEAEAEFVPPFRVGTLLISSLDGFLTAASLHMGDTLDDGRRLEHRDADEAWLALLGATGLLLELAPVLNDEIRQPYETILSELLRRYGEAFPDKSVPTPTKRPMGSLRNILQDAWNKVAAAEPPAMVEVSVAAAVPTEPAPQTPTVETAPGVANADSMPPGQNASPQRPWAPGLPGTGPLRQGSGPPRPGTGPLRPGSGPLPPRGTGPLRPPDKDRNP